MTTRAKGWMAAVAIAGVAGGLGSVETLADELRNPRSFVKGEILRTEHPLTNDLLTAGLGQTGIRTGVAADGTSTAFADPLNPTTEELRRAAIFNNYQALVDFTEAGGYGTFYGPGVPLPGAVDPAAIDPTGEGRIPGVEFLTFAGDASGRVNVATMVQIPDHFDPGAACIVTAPSSGSRGVYGAIGTSGEWGLKRGCAVAYTDKGTGTGAHDLQDDTVNLITGQREDADTAGRDSHFTANVNDRRRRQFNAATPDRFAFKHAHSEQNPEADWGQNVLESVELAFHLLNEEFPDHDIGPENTTVIASSVSNGGGASVRAAEQDRRGLIDGVAVSEPNVNPTFDASFGIQQGSEEPLFEHSRSLYDYTTALDVYQGCANRGQPFGALLNLTPVTLGDNRCQSLRDKGLLSADSVAGQAAEAQAVLNDEFAIQPEQNVVQPSHSWLFVSTAITVIYANAYGRESVLENLCGFSFGATNNNILDPFPDLDDTELGLPGPLLETDEAALFSVSNGIPPTGGVNLINNESLGGPRETRVSTSPSSGLQDQNLDGALCLRALATGFGPVTGAKLTGPMQGVHQRIQRGIEAIRASGDLRGKPAVFVTGRNDAILPINHTSRAYFGLNRVVEGSASGLRYYEVLNAQHLDTLNRFPGFDARFIPLHHYFVQAHDLLFEHLTSGTSLPPSQVVRTVPRGTGAPALEAANIPDIAAVPEDGDRIRFEDSLVKIPE